MGDNFESFLIRRAMERNRIKREQEQSQPQRPSRLSQVNNNARRMFAAEGSHLDRKTKSEGFLTYGSLRPRRVASSTKKRKR